MILWKATFGLEELDMAAQAPMFRIFFMKMEPKAVKLALREYLQK